MLRLRNIILLPILLVLWMPLSGWGQVATTGDSILVKKKFLGKKYMRNDEELKIRFLSFEDFEKFMNDSPEAMKHLKSAESYYVPAYLTASVGGGLIGWPIGGALAGKEDVNWNLAYIGAGFVAVSIIFSESSRLQLKQAIEIYNSGDRKPAGIGQPSPEIGSATSKFMLTLNF